MNEESTGLIAITASLRVFSPDLKPGEVSELLKAEPTAAWVRGEVPAGRRLPAVTGMWYLDSDLTGDASVDQHLESLLGRVSHDLSSWRDLASRFEVDVFLGGRVVSDNLAFSISQAMARELGKREIGVTFDFYLSRDILLNSSQLSPPPAARSAHRSE